MPRRFASAEAGNVTVVHRDELASPSGKNKHRSIVLPTSLADDGAPAAVGHDTIKEVADIIEQRRRNEVYNKIPGLGVCRRLCACLCPKHAAADQQAAPGPGQPALKREQSTPGETIRDVDGTEVKVDRDRTVTLSEAFAAGGVFAAKSPGKSVRAWGVAPCNVCPARLAPQSAVRFYSPTCNVSPMPCVRFSCGKGSRPTGPGASRSSCARTGPRRGPSGRSRASPTCSR